MLSIDEISEKLRDKNLSVIAEKIGVSRAYLSQIRMKKANPTYDVLKKLSDYLEGR